MTEKENPYLAIGCFCRKSRSGALESRSRLTPVTIVFSLWLTVSELTGSRVIGGRVATQVTDRFEVLGFEVRVWS